MIMTLQNAIARPPSVDGGRSRFALGLVDQLGAVVVVVVLVEAGRQVVAVLEIVALVAVTPRPT